MSLKTLLQWCHRLWVVDFEFRQVPGQRPEPWCGVGRCIKTGEIRVWRFDDPTSPVPYTTGPGDVVAAYAASAEGSCILALGMPQPRHWIDLLPLHRRMTNVHGEPCKGSLLAAAERFGLSSISEAGKHSLRELAIRGAPFTGEEFPSLIHYCKQDVDLTVRLLPHLLRDVRIEHALFFGRYTGRAVSAIEHAGVPIDLPLLQALTTDWKPVKSMLRHTEVGNLGVYREDGSLSHDALRTLARRLQIPWPHTEQGRLKTDDDTLKALTARYPVLRPFREYHAIHTKMSRIRLTVGLDGRNRTAILPFSSRTGRNQPSSARFIFGPPAWMRSLIKAPPGYTLIALDYSQQEFLIAAALSGDANMLAAYNSGDPYMAFAIKAGAAPEGATKATHPRERALYKTAMLGLQFGIGSDALGLQVGSTLLAKDLIAHHQRVFAFYRKWAENLQDRISLCRETLTTPLGWQIACRPRMDGNVRSVVNWPVQSTGGDIMRVAAVSMVEHGLEVVAPIHDAFLILCRDEAVEQSTKLAHRLMVESSQAVLGVPCAVDVTSFGSGGRYRSEKGEWMFSRVMEALKNVNPEVAV